ncbi:ThiF family adenylyltransferase [Craurococcus roseus]|uniref:ThiF family adenylyltransferase n=1 Tax=Craurococcus roseus TaxID=77585 RepID=UPI0031D5BBAF
MILRSIQRPAFHARVMDTHRDRIGLLRWSGLRMDTEFMFDRDLGGAPGFAARNIALVGCGTIGGHLAKFLGQSGAGHRGRLSLVDPEKLAPGNIGRHWLGPRHVGAPKAEACRDEIKAAFPHSDVRAHACSILEKLLLLASADLVVDATGEEAVSIALNQRLVDRRPSGPAAVHVWLAGNGAAAQCLFVGHKGEEACLKCLRPAGAAAATRPDWPLAPGAGLREAPAACGEAAFVPYGVAAPAIAAGLALKVCLGWD